MTIDSSFVSELCSTQLRIEPDNVRRCAVGIGNYVFMVYASGGIFILRCSMEEKPYTDTAKWLTALSGAGIPVPRVIDSGRYEGVEYIALTYIQGRDIGLVYHQLDSRQKQAIAREVVSIQRRAAAIDAAPPDDDWCWENEIDSTILRASELIEKNGYFSPAYPKMLMEQKKHLSSYFDSIRPIPYLDDISTKNLVIHNGQVSGIIDVDWMGFGDSLTYIALTCVALLNDSRDTEYVEYLMEETAPSPIQVRAFVFYCLMYCVDFMGERGSTFGDKTIEVNSEIVSRLDGIFQRLWSKWIELISDQSAAF